MLPLLVYAAAAQPVPFVEPPVRASVNGLLETDLIAAPAVSKAGSFTLHTATYNKTKTECPTADCQVTGPTLELKPGDMLAIHMKNAMGNSSSGYCAPAKVPITHSHPTPAEMMNTNLHTHGLQVAPQFPGGIPISSAIWQKLRPGQRGDRPYRGDNPLMVIEPGQTCDYAIQLPNDQPGGLYWYHPHFHMAASKQVWGGLAGAIIVRGGVDNVPEVKAAKERLMILQELWIGDNGTVPQHVVVPTAGYLQFTTVPAVPTNLIYTINGVPNPTVPIGPGEVERWRILAASAHRAFKLEIHQRGVETCPAWDGQRCLPFHQIGQDGIKFYKLITNNFQLMASGNRVDVLVKAPDVCPPGGYELMAVEFDQGHPGGPLEAIHLASIECAGTRVDGKLPASLGAPYIPPGAPAPPQNMTKRQIVFSGNILPAPVAFLLDGKEFDGTPQQKVTVDNYEEWTLVNLDVFRHPFHIHVNPFQVIETGKLVPNQDGIGFRQDDQGNYLHKDAKPVTDDIWWDTLTLPKQGYAKVRMWFRKDITGTTVYHCHILPHEDNGMMAAFELFPKPPK